MEWGDYSKMTPALLGMDWAVGSMTVHPNKNTIYPYLNRSLDTARCDSSRPSWFESLDKSIRNTLIASAPFSCLGDYLTPDLN